MSCQLTNSYSRIMSKFYCQTPRLIRTYVCLWFADSLPQSLVLTLYWSVSSCFHKYSRGIQKERNDMLIYMNNVLVFLLWFHNIRYSLLQITKKRRNNVCVSMDIFIQCTTISSDAKIRNSCQTGAWHMMYVSLYKEILYVCNNSKQLRLFKIFLLSF